MMLLTKLKVRNVLHCHQGMI